MTPETHYSILCSALQGLRLHLIETKSRNGLKSLFVSGVISNIYFSKRWLNFENYFHFGPIIREMCKMAISPNFVKWKCPYNGGGWLWYFERYKIDLILFLFQTLNLNLKNSSQPTLLTIHQIPHNNTFSLLSLLI